MSTATVVEHDPARGAPPRSPASARAERVAPRRAARGRGDLARPGRQPAGGLRRALAPAARAELLHDRLCRSRVERRGRARAARRRPGAPPLPLGRVLSRTRRPGRDRRAARHHARRRRGRGRADRGRTAQGVRAEGARRPPDDLDDRVAPAARGRDGARDRPRRAAPRDEPLARGRHRALLVRRRLAQPCRGAGGAQHHRADRVSGPPAAAPLRVRGQRARDQRPVAAGLGRVRAHGTRADPLRDRVRARPRRGARRGARARRLGARTAATGRSPSANGALPESRGRRRGDGVSHAAGDSRRLRARPDPRHRALARVGGKRDRRGARRRLPRGA